MMQPHPMISQENPDIEIWRHYCSTMDEMRQKQLLHMANIINKLYYGYIDKYGLDYGVHINDELFKQVHSVLEIYESGLDPMDYYGGDEND